MHKASLILFVFGLAGSLWGSAANVKAADYGSELQGFRKR